MVLADLYSEIAVPARIAAPRQADSVTSSTAIGLFIISALICIQVPDLAPPPIA